MAPTSPSEARTGAVTLIQRFGSAANLNIHLHCLVLDGVYRTTEGLPVFHAVRAPTPAELQALLARIIKRLMKFLTRKGFLIEEQGMTTLAETDPDLALGPLRAAACTYRIAFGPRAGQKVLSLQTVPSPAEQPAQERCASAQGFSLHAEVCCAAHQRHKLEHLCRYITRPAIANERLTLNRAGQVVLTLKTPYRDGTTQVVMSPLEFMQRLAALVPRPRLHLIRFHGVLAPNAKLRSEIVPSSARQTGNVPVPGFPSSGRQTGPIPGPGFPSAGRTAGNLPVLGLPGAPIHATDSSDDPGDVLQHSAPARMSWARLLKRVFDIDIEHCPHCGGTLKIIAATEDPPVIAKILTHLGWSARAPPRAPARPFDRFQMA